MTAALNLPVMAVFCYPADLPPAESPPEKYAPYGVPSVVLRPPHTLPECRSSATPTLRSEGCVQNYPHCITQVTVDEMWEGWQELQNMCKQRDDTGNEGTGNERR